MHEIAAGGSARAVPRALWGFSGCVRAVELGAERERQLVCRVSLVRKGLRSRNLHVLRQDRCSEQLRIKQFIASAVVAGGEPAKTKMVAAVADHGDMPMMYPS